MKSKILTLFTRTPLHVGAGASVGAIDQPVQRERHTGFPIIPGSSLKGVMRDYLSGLLEQSTIDVLFGKEQDKGEFTAGHLSFGEARLVAFPVRSACGAFALAVSPLTLRRLARDADWDLEVPSVDECQTCLAGDKIVLEKTSAVVLEEYRFESKGQFPVGWEEKLVGLLDDAVLKGAKGRFVLLSDGDLCHFAINACQVNQHVRIDDETGTAKDGALFNEETVPSEALFYSSIVALREASNENDLFKQFSAEKLIQFGGGGSSGLGFCTVKFQ